MWASRLYPVAQPAPYDRLRAITEREGRAIWGVSRDKAITMRMAAYVHTLQRLAEAIEAHGTQSFFTS